MKRSISPIRTAWLLLRLRLCRFALQTMPRSKVTRVLVAAEVDDAEREVARPRRRASPGRPRSLPPLMHGLKLADPNLERQASP